MISLKSYPEFLPLGFSPWEIPFFRRMIIVRPTIILAFGRSSTSQPSRAFSRSKRQATALTDGHRSRHYRLRRSGKVCSMTMAIVPSAPMYALSRAWRNHGSEHSRYLRTGNTRTTDIDQSSSRTRRVRGIRSTRHWCFPPPSGATSSWRSLKAYGTMPGRMSAQLMHTPPPDLGKAPATSRQRYGLTPVPEKNAVAGLGGHATHEKRS